MKIITLFLYAIITLFDIIARINILINIQRYINLNYLH